MFYVIFQFIKPCTSLSGLFIMRVKHCMRACGDDRPLFDESDLPSKPKQVPHTPCLRVAEPRRSPRPPRRHPSLQLRRRGSGTSPLKTMTLTLSCHWAQGSFVRPDHHLKHCASCFRPAAAARKAPAVQTSRDATSMTKKSTAFSQSVRDELPPGDQNKTRVRPERLP